MKKLTLLLTSLLFLTACGTVSGDEEGFNKDKEINVVSREDGSGTRGAFVELIGIEEKDANGNKKDLTTQEAIIANKTDVMMNNIKSDVYAMGYLSLGSLNDTIKALDIDGVSPSVENIQSGDYKVARPFNIVLSKKADEASDDFVKYILSTEGQAIVEANGYIPIEASGAYEKVNMSGKIVVAGSSSVSPVMEKLAESYKLINPQIEIEIQTSDSTVGVIAAIDGTADIGMASRALKDEEAKEVEGIVIAMDGIVVIVNLQNPLTNLNSTQVKDIYTGKTSQWNQLSGE